MRGEVVGLEVIFKVTGLEVLPVNHWKILWNVAAELPGYSATMKAKSFVALLTMDA